MNRLQLVQRLRQEAGVAGTGPTTTLNQTGELRRLVDWVDAAWAEIQRMHKWDFMWEQATVTIPASNYKVAGSIAADRYVKDGCYLGTSELTYLQWQDFRLAYPVSLMTSGAVPSFWTVQPDKAVSINVIVPSNTSLTLERYTNPVAMTADADQPSLPSDHHMAIVWKAMLMYCNFEEAGVSRATTEAKFNEHLNALGVSEMPTIGWGGALC